MVLARDIARCFPDAVGVAGAVLPNLPFTAELEEEPMPSRPGSLEDLITFQFSCFSTSEFAAELHSAIFSSKPLYAAKLHSVPAIERRLRRTIDGAVYRPSDVTDLPPSFPYVLDNVFSASRHSRLSLLFNLVPRIFWVRLIWCLRMRVIDVTEVATPVRSVSVKEEEDL